MFSLHQGERENYKPEKGERAEEASPSKDRTSNGECQTPLTRGEGHPVWRERCLGRGIGEAGEAGSDAENPLRKARDNKVPSIML